jgi:hypothetical protein
MRCLSYNIYTVHGKQRLCKSSPKAQIGYAWIEQKAGWITPRKDSNLEYNKSRKFKVIVFIIVCLW